MKLLTKELEEKFEKYPLGSQDGKGGNAEVLVKYFNPCGAGTWLITEAEKQEDGDYLLYGYCHIFEWEWGTVMLSELENLQLPFGLKIERDLYSANCKFMIWEAPTDEKCPKCGTFLCKKGKKLVCANPKCEFEK